jgi:hypothetical protein
MEIVNERTGETWNYSKNNADVLFEGVFTPQKAPTWMRDRAQVWNALEKAERQYNAQVLRNFTIALPHELTLEQQRYAVQDWVKENFTRKGFIADVAIHKPSSHGDTRNIHAHVGVSMRTVEGDGFATAKYRSKDKYADLDAWRESWERIGNKQLERFGHAPTLDRRTLVEQGSDLTPTIHLGKSAAELERDGKATDRGDILRTIQRENAAKETQRQIEQAANANAAARDRANDDAPQIEPTRPVQIAPETTAAQSAVDRMSAEDRAEQIEALRALSRSRWATMGDELRGIFSAVRSLATTMGGALFDIVKGGGFFQAKAENDHLKTMQEKASRPAIANPRLEGVREVEKPRQEPPRTVEEAPDAVRTDTLEQMLARKKAEKLKRDPLDTLRDRLHSGKRSRENEPDI